MQLMQDPVSGLLLDRKFVDEKQALKKVIDGLIDKAVNECQHIKHNYFLVLHMKFNQLGEFQVSQPMAVSKLPPFTSNQMVFWVSNARGICELLWMVPAKKKGEKLKPEFNKNGVAYLQAKGGMPS